MAWQGNEAGTGRARCRLASFSLLIGVLATGCGGGASSGVSKATSPTISWATPASIVYGTVLNASQLNASANVAGTFVYSPGSGALLTAGSNTLSATFTPSDMTDYTTATATTQLTVEQAAPTITWAAPASISSSTTLNATQLDATANVAGTFVYSPALGAVLPVGNDTLSVTFTPNDTTDYATVKSTVPITVTAGTLVAPVVTWATPLPILYGTPLTAAQLNATANVPGTFVYSPGAGAVEPVGSDTLSVTFAPSDTSSYSIVQASVQLTVTSSTPGSKDILSFVKQMVNLDNLAEFPGSNVNSGISDSKDPRAWGPYATCFYCNVDGGNFLGDITVGTRTEHIMLNVQGPGVITRFWIGGPAFTGYNIRFYFDGSSTPSIVSDLNALMQSQSAYISNSQLEYQAGETYGIVLSAGTPPGLDLYLPIPFEQSVMVTYDGPDNTSLSPLVQAARTLDFIFEYEQLSPGTPVSTYTLADYNNNLPAITAALTNLPPVGLTAPSSGPFTDAAATVILNQTIPAGGNATVQLPNGANAIRFLQTNVGTSGEVLAGLTMNMTFDGENTVSSVPFGSFFGSGAGLNAGTTMTQSVTADGTLTSRWTMPYQNNGSLIVSNTTDAPVMVSLSADIGPYQWDANSMHFHAYRRVNGPFVTTNNQSMRFLEVLGSGVYVGDNEVVDQTQDPGDTSFDWWGEGDELVYIDSSLFPRRGTGSEDYFGYAYGNPAFFQSPWTSQVAVPTQLGAGENSFQYDGITVLNRNRLLDTIPFNKQLRFDFEVDDHDQSSSSHLQVDHTAFFYALPGATIVSDGIVSGGTYTINSKISGWNLDSSGGSIHTDIFKKDNAQSYIVTATTNGYYTIQDVGTGLYVGVPGNSPAAGVPLALLPASPAGCGLLWTVSLATGANDYYVLTNSCGRLVMDLVNGSTVPDTTVQQYTANGTDAQSWRFNLPPAQ
jgi:hypothetical protein